MLGCCAVDEELCTFALCLKAVMTCTLPSVSCFVDILVGRLLKSLFPSACSHEKLNAELLSEIHKTSYWGVLNSEADSKVG